MGFCFQAGAISATVWLQTACGFAAICVKELMVLIFVYFLNQHILILRNIREINGLELIPSYKPCSCLVEFSKRGPKRCWCQWKKKYITHQRDINNSRIIRSHQISKILGTIFKMVLQSKVGVNTNQDIHFLPINILYAVKGQILPGLLLYLSCSHTQL